MEAPETPVSEAAPELPVIPKGGSLLRERNFRLYFFGQLVSNSGTQLQSVVQVVYVNALTTGAFMGGVTVAAVFLPILLLSLHGGRLADRFDRRRLFIGSQILAMAATGTLAVLVAAGHAPVFAVIIVAALVGVQYAVAIPTMQALLPAMVESRRLGEAIGWNSVTFNFGRVLGPALSTVAIATVGFAWAFGLNSLSFLAIIVALASMRLVRTERATSEEGTSVRDGLRYAWRNRRIRLILIAVLALSFAIDPMVTLAPAAVHEVFHRSRHDAGLILAAFGFGALVAVFAFRRLFRASSADRYRYLTLTMLLFAGGVMTFAWVPSFWLSLPLLGLAGAGFVVSNTTWVTGLQEEVSDAMRGRVMGLWTVCALGSRPFAALLDGGVSDLAGPRVAMLVICLPLLLVALTIAPRFRPASPA
jgi:MFS family permease